MTIQTRIMLCVAVGTGFLASLIFTVEVFYSSEKRLLPPAFQAGSMMIFH